MKFLKFAGVLSFLVLTAAFGAFGQNANGCVNGKRLGIFYTDCYQMNMGETDDTERLQRALDDVEGRLIFNQPVYYIDDTLVVSSHTIIEGTGKDPSGGTAASRIVLTADNESVFFIGAGIQDVTIRDLGFLSSIPCYDPKAKDPYEVICNTTAIKMEGGGSGGANASALIFLFNNLRFQSFGKAIYAHATNQVWQVDNVRLDHCMFDNNVIGVHLDSNNSGWDMDSLEFSIAAKGIGVFMERGSYISMNLLIGNGPVEGPNADALLRVRGHANFSLTNSTAEQFDYDLILEQPADPAQYSDRNYPIYLGNNAFISGVSVDDATVVSVANQFGFGYDNSQGWADIAVIAKGASQITSIGDKFCFEGYGGGCFDKTWELQGSAQMLFSTNQYRNSTAVPTRYYTYNTRKYFYEMGRSPVDGSFTFESIFQRGSGYMTDPADPDYSGYYGFKFKTYGGTMALSASGNLEFSAGTTITLGSTNAAGLGASTNGTLFYCSDCTATSTCAGSGSGAIAKRINGAWVCN